MKNFFFHIVLFLFFGSALQAQTPIRCGLDSNSILVGEQANILYQIPSAAEDSFWLIPSLGENLEILSEDIRVEGDSLLGSIGITAWDTGIYTIPVTVYVQHKSGIDSIAIQPLMLGVATFEVDTAKGIIDIKGPIDSPFSLQEILFYVLVALFVLTLVFLAIYFWVFRKQKAKAAFVEPSEPAYDVALRKLTLVREGRLWEQGELKEYYIQLTYVIREYLNGEFGINANEMVTDESVKAAIKLGLGKNESETLRTLLNKADMVKFAKAKPHEAEHIGAANSIEELIHTLKGIKNHQDG